MASAKYETAVTLPTNGNLYEDGPVDVILRSMTTQEEKLLYGSTSGDEKIKAIIKACIVEPKDLDINRLVSEDYYFLLLKLRILTYGNEYKIEPVCPYCHHSSNVTVDLDSFPVYLLDDDFSEPIRVELPMSGDVLECKLLRLKDSNAARKQAKKFARGSKLSADEIAYTYRLAKQILSINGKETNYAEAQQYVQNMHARDSAYMQWKINNYKLGYDMTVDIESCPNCGEEFEVPMPMSSEFFRPSFD